MAEVYGNRTHLSGYQPKTLDLKSRLPTSDRDTSERGGIYNNFQPQSQRHSSLEIKKRCNYSADPQIQGTQSKISFGESGYVPRIC